MAEDQFSSPDCRKLTSAIDMLDARIKSNWMVRAAEYVLIASVAILSILTVASIVERASENIHNVNIAMEKQ